MQTTVVVEPGKKPVRIGRNGITRPTGVELAAAGLAAFIATLDLMLLPYAVLSLLRLV